MSHWCSLCPGMLHCYFCKTENGDESPLAKRLRCTLGENDYACKRCRNELVDTKVLVDDAETKNLALRRKIDSFVDGTHDRLVRNRCAELEFVNSIVFSSIKDVLRDVSFLKQLSDYDEFKDFTFVFDSIRLNDSPFRIRAHRFVLAGKSTVFREMFSSSTTSKQTQEIVVSDASFYPMQALIHYCYTADINFSNAVLPQEVFKLAHKYKIQRLQDICVRELLTSLSDESFPKMMRFSRKYGSKLLEAAALEYLEKNFQKVAINLLDDIYGYTSVSARLARFSGGLFLTF